MQKNKNQDVCRKAWNLLRLAMLWARKGGVFLLRRRRRRNSRYVLPRYGERELSFDRTPIFHVKMHRPRSIGFKLPCLNPTTADECDFGGPDDSSDVGAAEDDGGFEVYGEEDEEIDVKAEEFIAKFYEQIKLQRQISYLQYS